MKKDAIIESMVLSEKKLKEDFISSIETIIREELANIFFNNHKFTDVSRSDENKPKREIKPFNADDYATVSEFLNAKVIRFENDNTNVFKLLKDTILNNYSILSDAHLKSINEDFVLECKIIIKGSARFFAYDNSVLKAFQKNINHIRKESFLNFLTSTENIEKQWKENRFLSF